MENQRIIIASTAKDSQGGKLSPEALVEIKGKIEGPKKARVSINHSLEHPPLGYQKNPQIIHEDNVDKLLCEYQSPKRKTITVLGNNFYEEYYENPIQYNLTKDFVLNDLEIEIDDFSDIYADLVSFTDRLEGNYIITQKSRKAEYPDPEVTVWIKNNQLISYLLFQGVLKVVEGGLNELGSLTTKQILSLLKGTVQDLSRIFSFTFSRLHKNRPFTFVINARSNFTVEFIVGNGNIKSFERSLSLNSITRLSKEISAYSDLFEIDKIQFKLSNTGKWKFTYLITTQGSSIGNKKIFESRDKVYDKLKEHGYSFSISYNAKFQD